jgi:hypothetical protein
VEKGGWLDQILLGILSFLNQPWVGITVGLGGSILVAFLARLSPKRDWEYISEGPGKLLAYAFIAYAFLRSVPRLVMPKSTFVCDRQPGPFGIPQTTNCHFVTSGRMHFEYDYTLLDFGKDVLFSIVQDIVFGSAGFVVGLILGTLVKLLRAPK